MIAGACEAPPPLWIPTPPIEDAKSIVLALHRARGPSVLAYDAATWDGRAHFSTDFDRTDSYRLEALTFNSTLAELELLPGPQHRAPQEADGTTMPAPGASYSLSLDAVGTSRAWTPTETPSAEVMSYRALTAPAPVRGCAKFVAELRTHPFREEGEFALRVDTQTALLGIRNEQPRLVSTTTAAPIEVQTVPRHLTPAGFWRSPTGELWIGERFGRVYRGAMDGNVLRTEAIPTNPTGGTLRWISGGLINGEVELYTVAEHGQVSRYYRGSWSQLHRFERPDRFAFLGGVVRYAPNRAVAVWPLAPYALRIERDEVKQEALGHSFSGVGHIPNLGVVVGGASGVFFRLVDDTWRELGPGDVGVALHTIIPFGNGFIYGDQLGFVGQYIIGRGFCPSQAYAAHKLTWMAALDDRTVITYGDRPGLFAELPYTILRAQD